MFPGPGLHRSRDPGVPDRTTHHPSGTRIAEALLQTPSGAFLRSTKIVLQVFCWISVAAVAVAGSVAVGIGVGVAVSVAVGIGVGVGGTVGVSVTVGSGAVAIVVGVGSATAIFTMPIVATPIITSRNIHNVVDLFFISLSFLFGPAKRQTF